MKRIRRERADGKAINYYGAITNMAVNLWYWFINNFYIIIYYYFFPLSCLAIQFLAFYGLYTAQSE